MDNEIILGIDLGTTNSLVAYVDQGAPKILKTLEGQNLLPSVISLRDGEWVTGFGAKRNKVLKPANTVFSVKRFLGRTLEDLKALDIKLPFHVEEVDQKLILDFGGKRLTAIEASALLLRELKEGAQGALGQKVTKAVITVPAYFNDAQRQATRAAGRLAGLDVLRILNEPTAAALAYGLNTKREGLIAVFDLGGGTFDVSILRLHDGVFEVLATHGDTALGGDDIDRALANVLTEEIFQKTKKDVTQDLESWAQVLEACERSKFSFSMSQDFKFELDLGGSLFTRSMSCAEFSRLARPIVERTRASCLAALEDSGLSAGDLTDVILVGGPTRLPVVKEVVREIFGVEPNASMHPDEVVALGAAIQGDILSGRNKEFLLLDVVPLSLGIETYGGLMSVLIPRNTRVPTVAREVFTNFVENQTGVEIHVLQGERERADQNRSLARFKLSPLMPAPAGYHRVEVTFLIDADGILQVSARDQRTQTEQTMEVSPSFGLSEKEIEAILKKGLESEGEDQKYRAWVEAKNEAESVLQATEKRLPDAKRLLTSEEFEAIEKALAHLKNALNQTNLDEVRSASFQLGHKTQKLADLLLKDALSAAKNP